MSELIGSSRISIVVGLGVTGVSVARYLHRHQRPFIVVDNRDAPPALRGFQQAFPDVVVETGDFNVETFCDADELIVSPGVSLQEPAIQAAIQHGVSIIGDIELFAREAKAPIVAITGSNAKSTVTTLVGQMAEASGLTVGVGGNIGTPALDLLERTPEVDLFVLELSSFQLETTHRLSAQVATILNISPDHMDRYPNMMAYMNAKLRVFFGAKQAVINRDDPLAQAPLPSDVRAVGFTAQPPNWGDFGLLSQHCRDEDPGNDLPETWLSKGLQPLIPVSQMAMRGAHNYTNALSALALGEAVGLSMDAMLDTLRHFRGLSHRCELVASVNGVDFINDSKATNLGAAEAALNGFHQDDNERRILLIAGGLSKGIDLAPLAPQLARSVKTIFLMGRDAKVIAAQWRQAWDAQCHAAPSCRPDIIFVDDLTEAVAQADCFSEAGDIVLLSPACASQDMFNNYQERGDAFKEAVLALSQIKPSR